MMLRLVVVGEDILAEIAELLGQSCPQPVLSSQPQSLLITEVLNIFLGIIIRICLVVKFLQFQIKGLDLGYHVAVLLVEDRHVLGNPGEMSQLCLEQFCCKI